MKTENSIIMQKARESLKGKWGVAIAAFLIYTLIMSISQINVKVAPPVIVSISGLISLIIAGPFALGISTFVLSLSRGQEVKLSKIFWGFTHFWKGVAAYLWMVLFILLWSLLFIVPGIIAAISYSMTFYLLADDPSLSAREAISKSKEMMRGYKWKYVCLHLRFLGWFLLCILTLGIGFLWYFPYVQVSVAKFYDDLKCHEISDPEVMNKGL